MPVVCLVELLKGILRVSDDRKAGVVARGSLPLRSNVQAGVHGNRGGGCCLGNRITIHVVLNLHTAPDVPQACVLEGGVEDQPVPIGGV